MWELLPTWECMEKCASNHQVVAEITGLANDMLWCQCISQVTSIKCSPSENTAPKNKKNLYPAYPPRRFEMIMKAVQMWYTTWLTQYSLECNSWDTPVHRNLCKILNELRAILKRGYMGTERRVSRIANPIGKDAPLINSKSIRVPGWMCYKRN